jgi:putative ABC transport system permease protein
LPGVQRAGITSALPLTWRGGTNGFTPEGMALDPRVTYDANNRVITPGYFETMKIPLVRGRFFDDGDGERTQPVAIINETMAKKFWGNQDPIGKRFKRAGPGDKAAPWMRIVGMVHDVRQMALDSAPRQEMYFPYWQSKDNWMWLRALVVRTSGEPMRLADAVRNVVWSIDRDQPVKNVMTLDDLLDQEVTNRRLQMLLLGALAALALILACVGIYGVLAYLVTQRTQEIGVRIALGAKSSDILQTIAGQGMRLAAMGIAAGLLASLALSRALQSFLYGVTAMDPLIYCGDRVVFNGSAHRLLYSRVPGRGGRCDGGLALRIAHRPGYADNRRSAIRTMTAGVRIGYSRRLGLCHVKSGTAARAWAYLELCRCAQFFSYLRFIAPGRLRSANDYNLSVIHARA